MIKNERYEELFNELNLQMQKLMYNNGDDNNVIKSRIRHSFRVMDIAVSIWDYYTERWDMDINNRELLKIACMMHDCAKFVNDDSHDILGAIITCSIMKTAQSKYKELQITNDDIAQINYMIETHSDKKQDIGLNQASICKAVLIDADIIEKFNVYHNTGDSIEEIFDNMRKYYNKKRKYIKTPKGGEMFDELMGKVDKFIDGSVTPETGLNMINKLTVDFNNPSNKTIDEK